MDVGAKGMKESTTIITSTKASSAVRGTSSREDSTETESEALIVK